MDYNLDSPSKESSSSDGNPKRDNCSGPKVSMVDPGKFSENQPRKKDDGRELDRDSDRRLYGRSSTSFDRQSYDSSHGYYRHDDYIKHDKHAPYSRSNKEPGDSDHCDLSRSRDYVRNFNRNSQDEHGSSGYRSKEKDREYKYIEHQKYKDDSSSERIGAEKRHRHFDVMGKERDRHTVLKDDRHEKKAYYRSSRDNRSERSLSYEDPRGHRSDTVSRRDNSKNHKDEGYKKDSKKLNIEILAKDQRMRYDGTETKRSKNQIIKEPEERSVNKDTWRSEEEECTAKRSKLSSLNKGIESWRDVSKFTTASDGREASNSKQVQDVKMTPGKSQASDAEVSNDMNAAKVAAMKAAELVNRNLTGAAPAGYMTADQKKKLLWGNKKNTSAVEAGHRWDTASFSDRERQEKFKKLMGVKGELKVEQNPNPANPEGTDLLGAERQKELQQDLEKQYTAGLRRRDGRTVGLGL